MLSTNKIKTKEIMPAEKKVSEKSTKTELWEAYNKLAEEITGQPVLFSTEQKSKGSDALRSIAELKIKIGQDLDKISGSITEEIDNFGELQGQIAKEKRQAIEILESQRSSLQTRIERVRLAWEEEKKTRDKEIDVEIQAEKIERKRETDEYSYSLSLTRRKEADTFQTQKAERERALAEKEMAIKNRSEEIAAMEKEVAAMPEKIKVIVEETKAEISKELTAKFSAEIHELKLVHEHEKKIAELKTNNLESTVKVQSGEIENLKRQLVEATRQVKDVAISVIEGRSSASKPIISPSEPIAKAS